MKTGSSYHWLCIAWFSSSIAVLGCGGEGGGPKTARVSGTVTLQGKPLDGAAVYFMTDKFSGFGRTNAEGKYELVQGAVPGKNKVYISKRGLPEGVNPDPESGLDLGQVDAAEAVGVNDPTPKGAKKKTSADLVPEEFSNPQKSQLSFDVPAGGSTTADFRL